MQPRMPHLALTALAAVALAAGHTLRGESSVWAAQQEAEAAELRFLTSEWDSVQAELEQLQQAVASMRPRKVWNGLQVAASGKPKAKPAVKPEAKPAAKAEGKPAAPAESAHSAEEKKKAATFVKTALASGKGDKKIADIAAQAMALGGLGKMAKASNNPAALAPMLAMLKGLYESGRDRIANLNKQEKKSKERFEQLEKKHEARLADIKTRYNIEAVRNNATRDENKLYAYWPRCREREHRQYHNMLKIQHGTMQKEKMMIDMYEKTIAGQSKQDVEKKLGQLTGEVPEVVFLQVAQYCAEALDEVRAARGELAPAAARAHA